MRVLITKEQINSKSLLDFCAQEGIQLTCQSFIGFEGLDFSLDEEPRHLFFGSPRAVDYYLTQAEIPSGCAIYCIGKATANHLGQRGISVRYYGKEAGNPALVGAEIKELLHGEILHIALSTQSNHSILKALGEEQCRLIYVYKTLEKPAILPEKYPVYIFTSPSNAQAFLQSNTLDDDAIVIAWGQTTKGFLEMYHVAPRFTLRFSEEDELRDLFSEIKNTRV